MFYRFTARLPVTFVIVFVLLTSHASAGVLWDDFQVSGVADTVDRKTPRVAIADDGHYLVSWMHEGAGENTYEIWACLFAADGSPLTAPFVVNERRLNGTSEYAMAMNGAGRFVFVWRCRTAQSTYNIYLERYEADGTKRYTGVLKVNEEDGDFVRHPDVAIDSQGRVYVTWAKPQALIDGCALAMVEWDVYTTASVTLIDVAAEFPQVAADDHDRCVFAGAPMYRRLSAVIYSFAADTPSVLKPVFTVANDEVGVADVAMRPDGEWLVTWQTGRSGDTIDIKARRFTSAGDPIDNTFYVEHAESSYLNKFPQVEYGLDGDIAIVWTDNIRTGVHYRAYSPTGNARFSSAADIRAIPCGEITPPADVAVTAGGDALVVWADDRVDGHNVYAQWVSPSGECRGGCIRINERFSSAAYPAVAMSATCSLSVCAWQDAGDIRAQFFDGVSPCAYVSSDRIANAGHAGARPAVAAIDSAVLVVWEDSSGSTGPRTYGRRFARNLPSGVPVALSDLGTLGARPAVGAVSDRFLVAWEHTTAGNDTPAVHGQYLGADGAPVGQNFAVSTLEGKKCLAPAVGGNDSGLAAVAWHLDESRPSGGTLPILDVYTDVYLRLFGPSGSPLTDGILVNDSAGKALDPAVLVDAGGQVTVAWLDRRGGRFSSDVYCQRYTSDGTPIGSNVPVDTSEAAAQHLRCAVRNDGAVIFVWYDGVRDDIVSRTMNADGTFQEGETRHNNSPINFGAAAPDVAAGLNGAFVAWTACLPESVSQREIWGEVCTLEDQSASAVSRQVLPAHNGPMTAPSPSGCDLLGRRIDMGGQIRSRLPSGVYLRTEDRYGRRSLVMH